MRFRLTYRGQLPANGDPVDKHKIRLEIHRQLKRLWAQRPLSEYEEQWKYSPEKKTNWIRRIGSYEFRPLVNERMDALAELDILFLQPEPPGAVVRSGGDIDNRIKTLLDALRRPLDINELPQGWQPSADESPLHCLLDDDRLVSRLDVKADQLFEPSLARGFAQLVIAVQTRVTRASMANADFSI